MSDEEGSGEIYQRTHVAFTGKTSLLQAPPKPQSHLLRGEQEGRIVVTECLCHSSEGLAWPKAGWNEQECVLWLKGTRALNSPLSAKTEVCGVTAGVTGIAVKIPSRPNVSRASTK